MTLVYLEKQKTKNLYFYKVYLKLNLLTDSLILYFLFLLVYLFHTILYLIEKSCFLKFKNYMTISVNKLIESYLSIYF